MIDHLDNAVGLTDVVGADVGDVAFLILQYDAFVAIHHRSERAALNATQATCSWIASSHSLVLRESASDLFLACLPSPKGESCDPEI